MGTRRRVILQVLSIAEVCGAGFKFQEIHNSLLPFFYLRPRLTAGSLSDRVDKYEDRYLCR
jgi:hypothetical protein